MTKKSHYQCELIWQRQDLQYIIFLMGRANLEPRVVVVVEVVVVVCVCVCVFVRVHMCRGGGGKCYNTNKIFKARPNLLLVIICFQSLCC